MTKGPELTVACLGAGYFSQFHHEAWERLPQVRRIATADLRLEAAEALGRPSFSSLEAMLDAEIPDILDIILPPTAHRKAILTAIDAGVQTIICQKPFCESFEEAEGVILLAERAGAQLIVHENFRFMPWYRAIKTEIDAGRIGLPLQGQFHLRPGDGQGPNAYLDRQPYFQKMPQFLVHETAVHWIDTFRYLFGNPHAVYADLRRINPVIKGEDAGFILFDHPRGVRTLFDGNRHCDHASDNQRRTMGEARFEGTEGSLSLSGDGSVILRAHGHQTTETVLPADSSPGFGGDCVYLLQQHVVLALVDGAPLENEARDYLDVIRIRDAVYKSDAAGQKVQLPRRRDEVARRHLLI
ncbi:Gfo/Idh/MocA family oxidoreductase [uncultured Roseobacter sp.]|uniref:Gfo/Idh/MocA family protein n=1 Tax=uncultured Roseobacter sp. TaxID=114847 RepID=UPI00262D09CB|nr:Gfo/Idh/MocA family oxidoreductase [uncultured Roseobacter sp.]